MGETLINLDTFTWQINDKTDLLSHMYQGNSQGSGKLNNYSIY